MPNRGEDSNVEKRRTTSASAEFSTTLKSMEAEVGRLRAKREAVSDADRAAKADRLVSFYTRIMTKAVDAERCSVFIHDPQRDEIWLKAGTGVEEHEIEVPKEGSIVGRVITSGEPVVVSRAEDMPGAHKTVDQETGFMTRSILCVPIKSPTRNEQVGAFEFLNKRDDLPFTDEDVALAAEGAEYLQEAVDRIFLDQEIYGISERLYVAARAARAFFLATSAVGLLIILGLCVYVFAAVVKG